MYCSFLERSCSKCTSQSIATYILIFLNGMWQNVCDRESIYNTGCWLLGGGAARAACCTTSSRASPPPTLAPPPPPIRGPLPFRGCWKMVYLYRFACQTFGLIVENQRHVVVQGLYGNFYQFGY